MHPRADLLCHRAEHRGWWRQAWVRRCSLSSLSLPLTVPSFPSFRWSGGSLGTPPAPSPPSGSTCLETSSRALCSPVGGHAGLGGSRSPFFCDLYIGQTRAQLSCFGAFTQGPCGDEGAQRSSTWAHPACFPKMQVVLSFGAPLAQCWGVCPCGGPGLADGSAFMCCVTVSLQYSHSGLPVQDSALVTGWDLQRYLGWGWGFLSPG